VYKKGQLRQPNAQMQGGRSPFQIKLTHQTKKLKNHQLAEADSAELTLKGDGEVLSQWQQHKF
jgi:hypothetical protein